MADCSVLFVCMGNICRSPTAEGVFRKYLLETGLSARVQVDSAGTHSYHIGSPPDQRSQQAAARRGIDISHLRARRVVAKDFEQFSYVLAMDANNLAALESLRPPQSRAQVGLLLEYAPAGYPREVPDPYYGGKHGFEIVLDMVDTGCRGLLEQIRQQFPAVDHPR